MSTTQQQSRHFEPSLNGDARQHAALLRSCGFALCKPDPAEKKPTYQRWGTYSLEASDFQADDMIGVIAGPLSDGGINQHALVIIDLDALKAVALADEFLPATGMEEGRKNKPRSHRYFLVPVASIPEWALSHAEQAAQAAIDETGHPGPFKKSFQTESNETLIDFIGTGGQAVSSPSLHSSGERREWIGGAPGRPAIVHFETLWLAVCRLAESCGGVPPSGLKWPWEERPPPPRHVFTVRATGSRVNVETRAINYLAKIPAAVSKQGGHRQTFYAARVIVYGFDLGADLGFRILKENYNPRCQPEWADHELWHKVQDADRLPYDKPRGWLNAERDDRKPATVATSGGNIGSDKPEDNPAHFKQPVIISKLVRPPRQNWTWEGFLKADGISLLSASWKVGKTTLLSRLLLAFGRGGTFLDLPIIKTNVLYITEENEGEWVERRDKLGIGDHVHVLSQPFDYKPAAGDWFVWLSFLNDYCRANQIGFTVFDTVSTFWPIKNENDASEVNSALMPMRKLAKGQSISVVHHLAKFDRGDGTGTRGSGALCGFADVITEMRRFGKEGDDDSDDDRRRVLTSFSRWEETPRKLVIRLMDDGTDYEAEGDGQQVKAERLAAELVKILPERDPGITADDAHELLPEAIRPKRAKVMQELQSGAAVGAWQASGTGRKGDPRRFWKPKNGFRSIPFQASGTESAKP